MKAWQVFEHGEPAEVLKLNEVPMPEPGPGQLLVRVKAAALNFPDVLLCRGQYQVRPPLPFTPGVELCGEVVSTGERVIGNPALPHGALAEYALADEADAFPAPSHWTMRPPRACTSRTRRAGSACTGEPSCRPARRCWCTRPPAASAARPCSWARPPERA